jgi:hypothetical protein
MFSLACTRPELHGSRMWIGPARPSETTQRGKVLLFGRTLHLTAPARRQRWSELPSRCFYPSPADDGLEHGQ